MEVHDQTIMIHAATKGYLDKVPVADVTKVENEFLGFLKNKHSDLRNAIASEKQISSENEAKLNELIKNFVAAL